MNRIPPSLADRRGVAALEFGLIAPVLLLLVLGAYDLTMWISAALRLNEVAANMGGVISECQTINDPGDINRFDTAAQVIAGGTDISTQSGGAFIISAVGYNANNALVVLWQRRSGNPAFASRIGASGAKPSLGGYTPAAGDVVIATEVFSGILPLYSEALFLARSATAQGLSSLNENAGAAPSCAS
jgi:Flp pilus assembly protein TadG